MPVRLVLFSRCWAGVLLVLVGGCSPTTRIRATPPEPAPALAARPQEAEQRVRLTVTLEMGRTPLPPQVQGMRFRVQEVRLKQVAGPWTTYPAGANSFEVGTGMPARKTVLATLVLPAAYDSLALTFTEVYVAYSAHAGGPLTLSRDAPLRMPLRLQPDRPTILRLTFEPGASLIHEAACCRWYFLPFVTATVE